MTEAFAFATPIVPGKSEVLRQFTEEMEGPRRNELEESRRRLGMTAERAWIQETPQGDIVIVYWEVEDVQRALEGMRESEEPFDKWFRQKVGEIHQVDLTQAPDRAPPEKIMDWEAGT